MEEDEVKHYRGLVQWLSPQQNLISFFLLIIQKSTKHNNSIKITSYI